MALIGRTGFETQGISTVLSGIEGLNTIFSGTPTIDTTLKRINGASLKCKDGQHYFQRQALGIVVGSPLYKSFYINITTLPAVDALIDQILTAGSVTQGGINLKTTGALSIQNTSAAEVAASTSTTLLSLGVWYRIEWSITVNTTTTGTATYKIYDATDPTNETLLETITVGSANFSASATNRSRTGWATSPTTGEINIDDLSWNDNTGANNNTYPIGARHIIALKPVSDNARGNWTGGAGGTTSVFDAIDNEPPVGLASASQTNTSQMKVSSGSGAAASNYDANAQSYATGGIGANDVINAIALFANTGQNANVADTPAGQLQIVSNPAQSADTFTTFRGSANAGIFPTGWISSQGTWVIAPSVTLATQPVVRIGTTSVSTSAGLTSFVDQFLLMVDYTPVAAPSTVKRLAAMGVG